MKTCLTLLLLMLLGFSSQVYAQYQDEIIVRKKGLGFTYYLNGRQISKNELLYVLDRDPAAKSELKRGHRNLMPASVLTYAGGLLIGYPLGAHLAGSRPNWMVAGLGASLITISLPFSGAVMKREHQAIYVYNGGVRYTSKPKADLRLDYVYNHAGLRITF